MAFLLIRTFGSVVGLLLLQLNSNCQNLASAIVGIKVIPTSEQVVYQNKNYSLLLFPNSSKSYYEMDSLRGMTPSIYLPDSAQDGDYIAFYDSAYKFPAAIFSYKNRKPDGLISWYNTNGLPIKESNYQSGELNGFMIFYDGFGHLTQLEEYKNGKRNGCSMSFFDSSLPSRVCHYKDDKLDGEYRQWAYRINKEYVLYKHVIYKNNRITKVIHGK